MHSHNRKSTLFVKRLSQNGADPEIEKTVKKFEKSNKSLEGAFAGRSA